MLRLYPILSIVFCSVMLFCCNSALAQTEDKLIPRFTHFDFNTDVVTFSPNLQTVPFNKIELISPDIRYLELQKFKMENGETALFEKLDFEQSKIDLQLPNLGEYHHYKNTFKYVPNDKLSFGFGLGLLQQNTLLSGYQEIYRFTFHSSVEYELTKWLSAYFYGQYVSNPLNSSASLFDPLQYMNPLFVQTEVGGGLKAKYKNIEAGVGMKAIYDTQFHQSNPIKSMDTKISIGF